MTTATATNVIPMRPFVGALAQAAKFAAHPAIRRTCIRAVLHELREGRNGHAIAGQLVRHNRHGHTQPPTGGAA